MLVGAVWTIKVGYVARGDDGSLFVYLLPIKLEFKSLIDFNLVLQVNVLEQLVDLLVAVPLLIHILDKTLLRYCLRDIVESICDLKKAIRLVAMQLFLRHFMQLLLFRLKTLCNGGLLLKRVF